MSKILADDPNLRVAGVVMVDSYHPRAFPSFSAPSFAEKLDVFLPTKPEIRGNTFEAFKKAKSQIGTWQMSGWDNFKPPPTILIRATEIAPVEEGLNGLLDPSGKTATDGVHGWSQVHHRFIEETYDVKGHHFSIFSHANVRISAYIHIINL